MAKVEDGGGRVAIVMNGSPLFTGDAGSGESEIRRWIFENDWLEAIVALPEQLFYNTGIATYIWVLSNHKTPERQGKAQLIDGTSFWKPMRKSLGDKRREMSVEDLKCITELYQRFEEGEHSKIFNNTDFGYRKITVERPLRLNFQASAERLARLYNQSAFANLAVSKKKDAKERAKEEKDGKAQQEYILLALSSVRQELFKNRAQFIPYVDAALDLSQRVPGSKKPSAQIYKAILTALSERDETAEICYDKNGEPEPDPELRDTENVPLSEDINTFFVREVEPHVPDAWINLNVRDEKDGEVGKVGYEINFNRYFYVYQPPRDLEEIEAEIKTLEKVIMDMLKEVTE
jgi:type I restriction enzyme M protein